jgi:amino-acid N-acetyltransferase
MDIIIKKPTLSTINDMQQLVYEDVQNGLILDRNPNEMATTIRSYSCAYLDNELVGFVALHIHTTILAEIRSLVVKKEYRYKGIGKKLIQVMIQEAKDLNVKEILVLTYQAKLFEQFGFKQIDKTTLPEPKIWADCIKCKHFPICDEIALTKKIG